MSLLENAFEDCTFIVSTKQPDELGGWNTVYTEGAGFKAAIVLNTSLQAQIAQKEGVTALYTVTTKKALPLDFHDIFRRESDGQIFRVTSNGKDNKTPASAGLNMTQVSAEEWRLASDVITNG